MKKEEIIKNIIALPGIEELNEMQRAMLETDSRLIVLTAPTGSGKTLAFACKILMEIGSPCDRVQALVIAPSRELAMQIFEVLRPVAKGYKTVALYGGRSVADERNSLQPVPDIVIGTPGRILDHIQRGNLTIHDPSILVIDEYDKALELGFEGEMKRIAKRIGTPRNTVLTSATSLESLPDYLDIKNYSSLDFSNSSDPRKRMEVVEVTSAVPDKLDTLVDLLRTLPAAERAIVFVNHRESASRVHDRLTKEHIAATLYHGALDQQQREMAIDLFSNGTTPVMVATDLAARGLDIANMDNVVHYHLPVDEAAWTHRNGRTARVDASGKVWVIISDNDSMPEYIKPDRKYVPNPRETSGDKNARPAVASIYIGAGKKEKISKGDVAGFVSASGVTAPNEIGKISLHDHYAVVAVPKSKVRDTVKVLNIIKLKGQRRRVSTISPGELQSGKKSVAV
ncbi:MAG: DEAD/DEAH box helicase [Bacteroides sp.]|nr:DEAD/DEAH box helicase [Bacteroides sp.]MCM1414093.1 DEAD/DEAH box helicase [Bacteroides sp.]MCM1472357.1 DEAD/DEAH box helicase [Bacteroides sp.]